MKLAELTALLARIPIILLGECPNFQGWTSGKSGEMDQNQGKWIKHREFPSYARWKVGNSRPEFWKIPLLYIIFLKNGKGRGHAKLQWPVTEGGHPVTHPLNPPHSC